MINSQSIESRFDQYLIEDQQIKNHRSRFVFVHLIHKEIDQVQIMSCDIDHESRSAMSRFSCGPRVGCQHNIHGSSIIHCTVALYSSRTPGQRMTFPSKTKKTNDTPSKNGIINHHEHVRIATDGQYSNKRNALLPLFVRAAVHSLDHASNVDVEGSIDN
mmetsp:Transcript_17282/g.31226  ORF Transcript_17282/g.31226 Transcript_17282/m.31226 type:complete len:160 (-) Transcript_17282:207-686(-)